MRTRNQNRKESVDSDWFSMERERFLKVQLYCIVAVVVSC